MIFYISDLHIGHKNALIFDSRPFEDVDTMETEIIKRWNTKISADDHVYILGDVFYKYSKNMYNFLKSLNGHLHLIIGNHDKVLLDNEKAASVFESIDSILNIVDNSKQITLCHFPIMVWNKKHRGSYHIYGHVHRKIDEDTIIMMKQERAFNAGCMINNYEPCTFDELKSNKEKFMKENNIQ